MSLFQEIEGFEDLYARLKSISCVLQFAPLRYSGSGSEQRSADIHRQAALAGLQIVKQRTDAYFEALIRRPPYTDRQRSEFFSVSIHPELIGTGQTVDVSAFLGPYCDYAQRRLLMRGEADEERRYYFWFGDPETPDQRQQQADVESDQAGLARAYLDPPYHLRGPKSQQNALFFEILDTLCGDLTGPVEIFAWSPDSSNFFDAGKEWWGCYFWTLHPVDSDRYVMIAASSTD